MATIEQPTTGTVALHSQHDARFRAWCAILLGALLLQVLLGAANVSWLDVPGAGDSTSEPSPSSLLATHAWLGTAIVIGAIVVLVLAIRSHDRTWIVIAVTGLVGVAVALASGDLFVRSHRELETASMAMACGAVLALAAYTVGLSRRRSS